MLSLLRLLSPALRLLLLRMMGNDSACPDGGGLYRPSLLARKTRTAA